MHKEHIKYNYSYSSSEDSEYKQLIEWIPSLINTKLHSLSLEQLHILHYILGYNCSNIDDDTLIESLEQFGFNDDCIAKVLESIKLSNFVIINCPY